MQLPSGRFRVDGAISLTTRNYVEVQGPLDGSFVAYTDLNSNDLALSDRIHWGILASTGCAYRWINIEGPNDERDESNPNFAKFYEGLSADHGFAVRSGSVDCIIEDCTFTEVYGDGIYVGFHNNGVANENITIRRVTGTYPGRQGLALTHVDGFVGEDITVDFCGRSGLDIEPNHDNDKVWDVTLTRCSFGSQFYPFTITGSDGSYEALKRDDITLADCSAIRCPSNHPALLASRGPSGSLTITGHTDLIQSSIYGFNIAGEWATITIDDCEVVTGNNTPTSYAVRANCTGTLTITDNVFNGRPGTEGFDELALLIVTPDTYIHSGNVWNMGASSD